MENTKQIKPLFDRVLLRPETERTTAAGIYIPRDGTQRSQIMTVVAIGMGIDIAAPHFAVGDSVIVAKYAGTEFDTGAEKLLLVSEYDILGVVS